jgi:NADH:ubiquinone oxidoreductase subunit 3 (subunit A)
MLTALFFILFVMLAGGTAMFLLAKLVEGNKARKEKNNPNV